MPPFETKISGFVLILLAVEYLFLIAGLFAVSATNIKNGDVEKHEGNRTLSVTKLTCIAIVSFSVTVIIAFFAVIFFSSPWIPGRGNNNAVEFLVFCAIFSGFCALIYRWITRGRTDRRIARIILCAVIALPVVLPAIYYSKVNYLTAKHGRELITVPISADWSDGVWFDKFKVLGYDDERASVYAKTCWREWHSTSTYCYGKFIYYSRSGNIWEYGHDTNAWTDRDEHEMMFPPL